jgi:hypothetical protein
MQQAKPLAPFALRGMHVPVSFSFRQVGAAPLVVQPGT